MKQLIYLFLMFVFFACSKAASKKYEEASISDDAYEIKVEALSTNTYETIVIQKFQNYTDLLQLKQKHPELEEDINTELQKLSMGEILKKYTTNIAIKDIRQSGKTEKISDSIQKVKLVYVVKSNNKTVKDSVFGYIKSTSINVDGKETMANKITFANE